jgi:HlyD family secretion protein
MDKKIEKKKWLPKNMGYYFWGALFLGVFLFMYFNRPNATSLQIKEDRVTISTVSRGLFREYVPVLGSVLPFHTVYLDAVEGGRVEKVFLRAGSQVKQGDQILKLSNTGLLMTLLNNEAQINRASNELRTTRLQLERNRWQLKKQRVEADYYLTRIKRKFERYQVLMKEQLVSRQEFEEFQDEYFYQLKNRELTIDSQEKDLLFQAQQVKALELSVRRMQTNLKLLNTQMESLTVRAPISGHLTSLIAEVGQSKSPGQRLGQIDETEGFKVRAEIDEHYVNRIQLNRKAILDHNGNKYSMIIQKIFPEIENGRFKIDLVFTHGEAAGIRRGQTVHIRLQLSEPVEAILLSRGGFYQTTGGNWAYVLDKSGSFAVKREIRLGKQSPKYYEVLAGLKPGDQVIISSYDHYNNIDRLEIY